MSDQVERRTRAGSVRVETRGDGGRVLSGHAAVFPVDGDEGTRFRYWDIVEEIAPGAFDRALEEKQDVRALFNHTADHVLGRSTSSTLRLSVDEIGLRYEIDLADTTVARDVAEHVARGDVSGSSFAFIVRREEFVRADEEGGPTVRRILDVDLVDVGPVTFPAYESTSAVMRSDLRDLVTRHTDTRHRVDLHRRRLDLLMK